MPLGKRFLLAGVLAVGMGISARAEDGPAVAEKPAEESVSKDAFFAMRAGDRFSLLEDIEYASPGSVELLLDAYVPKLAGPLPAVMVVHGGAWRSGSKRQLMKYARDLAARGIVTFAINYRLSPKYKFPAQLEDCRAGAQVDSSKCGGLQRRSRADWGDRLFGGRASGGLVGRDRQAGRSRPT